MGERRLSVGAVASVVGLGLLITACSGSDDSGGAAPPTPTPTPTPTHTTTTPPKVTSGNPHDPYPALCRKIVTSNAQKLFSEPLGPMTTGGGSDCQFAPHQSPDDVNTLKVYLRLNDGDKTLFNHIGDIDYGSFTPLTGLGFQAKWASQGFTPITVVDVRDGSFTCTVIPPQNEAVTTLDHPGSQTDQPVAKPVAVAFARDLGMLCRDIFTGR